MSHSHRVPRPWGAGWLSNRRRATSATATTRGLPPLHFESLEERSLLSVAPQGGEFQVNTYTATHAQGSPAVGMDSVGDYVIAWISYGQDGSQQGIYAQRYRSTGVAQGGEFQVNTYTTGDQVGPHVAMDAAGDFVVVWESNGQDGSGYGVYAQRYNSSGVAQGGEFQVNTYTTNDQQRPSVAMDTAGDFVITWQSNGQDGSGYGVYVQRYNSSGVAQGGEFRVNTYTTNDQQRPSVAMDSVGDFVIAWDSGYFLFTGSSSQDGSSYGVYAQRYNSAGEAQGGEFQANTYTTNRQWIPSVAMDTDGDFVIAWQSNGQDGNSSGVYAQRYNFSGAAQGGEFQVNTFTSLQQSFPQVAMDDAGDFVIAWQSYGQAGPSYSVYAQRYDAAGIAQDGEFRVNTVTTNDQDASRVAMDSGGDFVVAWQSFNQPSGDLSVYAQRYWPLLGDTNQDGVVDVADYDNVQNHYGQSGNPVLGDTNGDGVLDDEDYNNVWNHLLNDNLPTADVLLYHNDKSVTAYPSASDTDSARGTALRNALAAAQDGDEIVCGPGTFDLGANVLDLGKSGTITVSLVGAGEGVTIITSTATQEQGAIIQLGKDGCYVADLSIIGTVTSVALDFSDSQTCLGGESNDAVQPYEMSGNPFVNALVERVTCQCDATPLYLYYVSPGEESIKCTGIFRDCTFLGHQSAIWIEDKARSEEFTTDSLLQFFNCRAIATGGDFHPEDIIRGLSITALNLAVEWNGGLISCSGTTAQDQAVYARPGLITITGDTQITCTGDNAETLRADGAAGPASISVGPDVRYDTSIASAVNGGTITLLPAGDVTLNDNGLAALGGQTVDSSLALQSTLVGGQSPTERASSPLPGQPPMIPALKQATREIDKSGDLDAELLDLLVDARPRHRS